MEKQPLTERQREVYEWMLAYYRAHGLPPRYREIADGFGFAVGSVQSHLRFLEKKGWVKLAGRQGKYGTMKFVGYKTQVVPE